MEIIQITSGIKTIQIILEGLILFVAIWNTFAWLKDALASLLMILDEEDDYNITYSEGAPGVTASIAWALFYVVSNLPC